MPPSVAAPPKTPASTTPHPDPTSALLAALERIERRLDAVERVAVTLAPTAQLAQTLPGAVAMLADTFDSLAAQLGEAGVDLDERMRSVVRAVEVATAPRAVSGLAALVESKLLEPTSLATVSQLAAALADHGEAKAVGPWGALRALRDPDVQRALGFLLAVARQFGKNLTTGEVDACRDRLENAGTGRLLEGVR